MDSFEWFFQIGLPGDQVNLFVDKFAVVLVRIMKPQELIVRGEFAPRGGIQLTTEATFPEPGAES